MAQSRSPSFAHSLTNLPAEIIVEVLLNLSFQQVFTVSLVCRHLHSIATNNLAVQYHIQSQIAGISDNHQSSLAISERLSKLRSFEHAWLSANYPTKSTLPVHHEPSGIYDLSAGVLLLGDKHVPDSFRYAALPSPGQPVPDWKTVKLKNIMVDMGLCLVEHGLVAVVTGKLNFEDATIGYTIELIDFFTGKPHPRAAHPVLTVDTRDATWGKMSISMEIVGDHLALLTHHSWADIDDKLYVWNWIKGELLFTYATAPHTYSSLVFLSPDYILLPNEHDMSLDVIHISKSSDHINPLKRVILTLGLPELNRQTMLYTACRSEPNPMGNSPTQRDPTNDPCRYLSRPFSSDPQEAILHITFLVFDGLHDRFSAALIVHRKSILKLIPGITASRQSSNISKDNNNNGDDDDDDDEEEEDYEDTSTLSNRQKSTIPPPPAFPAYRYLEWDTWGPSATRWLPTNKLATRWITVTSGQRFATISSTATRRPAPVCVFDFNQNTVRRVKQALARGESVFGGSLEEEGKWDVVVYDEEDLLDSATTQGVNVFASSVHSGLPYVLSKSKENYDFDAVMMDDDRILGIHMKQNSEEGMERVDILRYAPEY